MLASVTSEASAVRSVSEVVGSVTRGSSVETNDSEAPASVFNV